MAASGPQSTSAAETVSQNLGAPVAAQCEYWNLMADLSCPLGSITMEDLISVMPFGSTFDMVQVKGSTLMTAFEHAVHRYGGSTGEFLQVSGTNVAVYLRLTGV